MALKLYTNAQRRFEKLPVCWRCGTVYKLSDCIDGHGIYQRAKLCTCISLYRGTHRQICNGLLVKTVELAIGKKIFYPLMTYCYIDLQTSLQHLVHNEIFMKHCTHWMSRNISDDTISDVYDGRIWKRFSQYYQHFSLEEDNSFAFMINIDWFQPYKHLTYSVGAIYLSVFNLPRSLRHKLQNICLIGIIPGPHEPELSVNSYIAPLVKDLLQFWPGVELNVAIGSHIEKKVHAAIICCSCDLPADRKLCDFLGHSAHLGCSKCKKYFHQGRTHSIILGSIE